MTPYRELILGIVAVMVGCASQPPGPSTTNLESSQAAARPNTPPKVIVTPAKTDTEEPGSVALEQDGEAPKQQPAAGSTSSDPEDIREIDITPAWTPTSNPDSVKCRTQTVTGSRLHRRKVCMTLQQWENSERNARRELRHLQRTIGKERWIGLPGQSGG